MNIGAGYCKKKKGPLRNPVINLGPALKPLLSALVLASAFAVPAFAEELSTFKDHLLYCEEVGGA